MLLERFHTRHVIERILLSVHAVCGIFILSIMPKGTIEKGSKKAKYLILQIGVQLAA